MKSRLLFIAFIAVYVLGWLAADAQDIQYLETKPLTQAVQAGEKAYEPSAKLKIPVITWGGDVATILARDQGIFKEQNLDVELFLENNFPKQVEECLSGKTPYLRGTLGMINSAVEVFGKRGLNLVVICQLTWSAGGDCMVVRKGKNLENIKTVGLQLYGPHMDYAAKLFQGRGRLDKVQFKWLSELTLPTYDTKGKVVDPVGAFQKDSSLDAVMCIIPDGLMLTSGGKSGTGAEGSVKGAEILLSTRTADKIIADIYAVRSDYFDAHKNEVSKFVRCLLRAQEELNGLKSDKSQQAKYRQLLGNSADLLLGAPQATGDVEALLADCRYVGHTGNVQFFGGKGTTRNFKVLTEEIQDFFIKLGLLRENVQLVPPGWDFTALGTGLKLAEKTVEEKPRFDEKKVQAKIEQKISVEPTSWEEKGTLFLIEINFEPNQSSFSDEKYASDYKRAVEIAQTYGGALIVIEGHSDPLGILKAKQENKPLPEISQMEQVAKNLSLERAQEVRKSFLAYAQKKNFDVDKSQFIAVGLGISAPKFNPPKTKDEWAANRRVVFRIKQVEAEMDEFVPLN
jgi:outer membrane protein OmpA-like peptidoglycan-associated protein/ABC-type nitrate/sulfonate/bicarbonate transport system substrate-binding protein